jgi:hypothetical protein
LWIRVGFNADPDPVIYLNADPDPGSQINADPGGPGPWTFKSQKVEFLHENIQNIPVLKVGSRSKNIHTKVQKPF